MPGRDQTPHYFTVSGNTHIDERLQCRRTMEVLAHIEVMQDVERSIRHEPAVTLRYVR